MIAIFGASASKTVSAGTVSVKRVAEVVYDEERIHERSRLIALGIDARQQRFPHEPRYVYHPLVGQEDANRWNEEARKNILKDYNLRDLGL